MPTIGDNIGARRRALALTQEALAEQTGLSVETIRKVEQGERTPRMRTLNTIARTLRITTSALMGDASAGAARRESDLDDVALVGLREALTPAPGLAPAWSGEPPTIADVEQRIQDADRAYHADRYAPLIADLPGMLADVQHLTTAEPSDHAWRLASTAHVITAGLLTQLRHHDLAYHAAATAITAAQRASDELVAAKAVGRMCWLLIRQGRISAAERLAMATADNIEPRLRDADLARIAEWGWLIIYGAAAAARDSRPDAARDMLEAAAAGAARMAGRQASGLLQGTAMFGPALVTMKRVEISIVEDDPVGALRLAQDVRPDGCRLTTDRYRHRLDVAHAHAVTGHYGDAVAVLRGVRDEAPGWLRHQRYAREVVHTVVTSRRRALSAEVAELAEFVGAEV